MEDFYTPVSHIDHQYETLKKHFKPNTSLNERKHLMSQIVAMLKNHENEWKEAMQKDLAQTEFVKMMEVKQSIGEAEHLMQNVGRYMMAESQGNSKLLTFPASNYLYKEPYGIVLVIGTWNYPLSTVLKPFAGALAAGNSVLVKPSEVTPNVSKLFAKLIPKYFDKERVQIVQGAVPQASKLLSLKWDNIFYTGNPMVGRIIAKAAAEHLTPVTLELGGKSPCYIDKDVNFDLMIKRISWGKWMNCGQTCVAPDYILVHSSHGHKLVKALIAKLKDFYGADPSKSPEYNRIVNERHVNRLEDIIDEVKVNIVHGGRVNVDDKYIEPTIVMNPPDDSQLMTNEIFGPILPIIEVNSLEEAIEFINERPKPLAAYCFSTNNAVNEKFITHTSSGGVCVNDVINHIPGPELPFGGIGNSGVGHGLNGKYTFDTFTHQKPVCFKNNMSLLDAPRYPPYSPSQIQLFSRVWNWHLPSSQTVLKWGVVAVGFGAAFYRYYYQ